MPAPSPTVLRRPRLAVGPLTLLVALSGCGALPFAAQRERSLTMSAAGVTRVTCTSGNGGIEVRGDPLAAAISVRARVQARGHSQDEAEARAEALRVTIEQHGSELEVVGVEPEDHDSNWSTTFEYLITAPPALAQNLTSHNGSIVVEAMIGDLQALTHNGRVRAHTAAKVLALETHNGSIEVALDGNGPVQGSITTHNGAIDLQLGSRTAIVAADTSNGGVHAAEAFAVQQRDDNSMVVEAGHGGGQLEVATHNGRIEIR